MKIYKLEIKSIQRSNGPMLGYMSEPSTCTYRYFKTEVSAKKEMKVLNDASTILGIHNNVYTSLIEIDVEE